MPVPELMQEAVTLTLSGGSPLPDIEAFIERQPLCEDEKAALWLWAWAEKSRSPLAVTGLPTGSGRAEP